MEALCESVRESDGGVRREGDEGDEGVREMWSSCGGWRVEAGVWRPVADVD